MMDVYADRIRQVQIPPPDKIVPRQIGLSVILEKKYGTEKILEIGTWEIEAESSKQMFQFIVRITKYRPNQ